MTRLTDDDRLRLAIDIGGTFVDFVLLNERSGEITVDKQASLRSHGLDELLSGYDRVVGQRSSSLSRIVHGMTLVINTILQERGAEVGLITTAGYRDALEIGRAFHPEMYDFVWTPSQPLVPRRLRREVTERMDVHGNVRVPLDHEELTREARFLVDAGVEVIAVSFLHSYANPEHEKMAKELLSSMFPDVKVACSYEVAPEPREYERTSTCVASAYVMPVVDQYFEGLERALAERGFAGDLSLMQSTGGVMSTTSGRLSPIRMLQSGPSGGVIGAAALGKALGEENLLCADVGGTSFDVGLIHGGRILEATQDDAGGRPIIAPTVDIESIGSGGGSVAWIDDRGALQVGPRSAGAEPGPACYGQGGTEPTITDCNLLLGRIDPQRFLGRRLRLLPDAAERAVAAVAEPLGTSVLDAAAGVLKLAEMNMVYALRHVTVERGRDPREFAVLAYGGGGGWFGDAIATELGCARVIIPVAASVFSAWGTLFADYWEDVVVPRALTLLPAHEHELAAAVGEMRKATLDRLALDDAPHESATTVVRADVRYVGQAWTLSVVVPLEGETDSLTDALHTAFNERHQLEFGHSDTERVTELVALRGRAIAHVAHPDMRQRVLDPVAQDEPSRPSRSVWFSNDGGGMHETSIRTRDSLSAGGTVVGPAVIEEWSTTTLVGPGRQASLDELGNIVITGVD